MKAFPITTGATRQNPETPAKLCRKETGKKVGEGSQIKGPGMTDT